MCADFRKSEIDSYLIELSKELKKEFGRNSSFELILIGGASVLVNYNFRDTTMDIDVFCFYSKFY